MILSLIAAIGKNNEIGKDNRLLWNMPADLRYFRDTTSGHPVIMGWNTFKSIGRPLPNRQNIVISIDSAWNAEGVTTVGSLEEAIGLFKGKDDEVFVIGGALTYAQAIALADRLYITHVDASFDADTFFPNIDKNIWHEVSRDAHESDEKNPLPYSFTLYEKSN
jgi:dihydrofolate reductase